MSFPSSTKDASRQPPLAREARFHEGSTPEAWVRQGTTRVQACRAARRRHGGATCHGTHGSARQHAGWGPGHGKPWEHVQKTKAYASGWQEGAMSIHLCFVEEE